jgi:hypothetical protein
MSGFVLHAADILHKITNLRTEMSRQIRKLRTRSGSAATSQRPRRYLEQLSFLRSVIVPRTTESNLTYTRVSMEIQES